MNKKKAIIILAIILVLGVAAGVIVLLCVNNDNSEQVKEKEVNLFVDGQVDFMQNGKWGIRTKDEVIIKPQYDGISNGDFYETIFGVYTKNPDLGKDYKRIKYRFGEGENLGYLDKDGKVVIDAKYGGTICLDGMVQAYKEEADWREGMGVIDEDDNVIVDFKYEYVGHDETTNIYWGSKYDKKNEVSVYSYFDEKGKPLTLNKKYVCVSPVKNGLVAIRDNKTKKEGLANTDGKVLCEPKYGKIMIEKMSESKIPFKDKADDIDTYDYTVDKEGRVGYLDEKGKVVIAPQYNDGFGSETGEREDKYFFENDRAIVHPETSYDENDKDYAHPENNLSLTQDIGLGVVDGKGNYIIQPKYSNILRLKNGNFYFEAASDGNTVDSYGFFTKDGELIRENNIHEDDYTLTDKIDNNRQLVSKIFEDEKNNKQKTKYGIVDEKGTLLSKIEYDSLGSVEESDDEDQDFVHHGIIVARKGDRYGYVSAKTGKALTKFEYLGASRFYDDGYAIIINKDKKAEIIDTSFKTILKADGFKDRTYEFYESALKVYNN